jgi:Common central domain of tyrosinase
LLYFEEQLQAAAGDPTLRLPYWDYTDPKQVAMPAEFTQPTYKDASGADQPNPLYEPRRDPDWRQQRVTLNPDSTNIDGILTKEANFARYQSDIENNLHGYVHCTVAAVSCPVPDMGAVPYSSNDPILWLHHANIDRLWSCWTNIPGHKNPANDSNFVGQPFSFIDATGQKITKKVDDLFNNTLVDYKYEQETNCARSGGVAVAENISAPANAAASGAAVEMTAGQIHDLLAQGKTLSEATKPVALSAATTKVWVELRNDDEMKVVNSLARGASAPVPTVTHLVLSGITFAAPPAAQFYVYLEDSADPKRREYAGTISFFNAAPHFGPHDHNHAESEVAGRPGLTREFDVTDALRKLSGGGKPDFNSVTISFEATSGRVGSSQTPEVNSKSNLTVNSIAFRVSTTE